MSLEDKILILAANIARHQTRLKQERQQLLELQRQQKAELACSIIKSKMLGEIMWREVLPSRCRLQAEFPRQAVPLVRMFQTKSGLINGVVLRTIASSDKDHVDKVILSSDGSLNFTSAEIVSHFLEDNRMVVLSYTGGTPLLSGTPRIKDEPSAQPRGNIK